MQAAHTLPFHIGQVDRHPAHGSAPTPGKPGSTCGTLHVTDTAVTCALNLRSHHPVLIDAGFAHLDVPIPWWEGRTLRFRFPPR
jgi:hypothetical protein